MVFRKRQCSRRRKAGRSGWRMSLCVALCLYALIVPAQAGGQVLDSAQQYAQRGDWHGVYLLLNATVSGCDTCYEERSLLAESMVRLRRELERAEIILSFQAHTPKNLLLHAEAQQLLYRFADAEKTYQEYMSLGDFSLLSRAETQQRIASCQSGEQLCMSGFDPWCGYRVKVRQSEAAGVVDTSGRVYTLVALPSSLKGEYDTQDSAFATQLAYPQGTKAGTKLIFPRRQFANGPRDLYITEQGADGLWTQPASVGAIVNSPYDESLAILAEDGKTLYFSSLGHYGLGGQDIFKSVYDPRVGQWSAPENIGFPYNSPADDYLVGIPNGRGEVLVMSNRNAGGDSVYIYSLEYNAQMAGVALEDAAARYARARFDWAGAPRERKKGVAAARADATLAVAQQTASFRDVEQDGEYRAALAEGYAQQRKADTLRIELQKLRERVWDAKTSQQRKALEQRIEPIEKGMLVAQKKADAQFVLASRIEQEYILGVRTAPRKQTGVGATGFAGDNPKYLHLAQLAPTVFQRDEIAELDEASKGAEVRMQQVRDLLRQQKEFRDLTADTSVGTTALAMGEEAVECSAQAFVDRYGGGIEREQQIYQQCLPVALMKSNRNEQVQVQACDSRAREQYRNAEAVENNSDPHAAAQGRFSALAFRMLGNKYMELGFSYAWGMVKYRDGVQRQIDTLLRWVAPSAERESQQKAEGDAPKSGGAGAIRLAAPKVAGLTIENPTRYTADSPVPRDEVLPKGVVYKLQLGAYTNPIDPALFRGMYPVSAVTANGGKVTKYYAGLFRMKAEADKGKAITAQCGFPESFVVAWYDGREVPLARAKALESTSEDGNGEAAQTAAGQFRVEVGAFEGVLPTYVSETLQLLAPGKELQKRPDGGGRWVYSVGVFTTRDDAERLCNNLKGSGLTEAKVLDVAVETKE